MNARRYSVLSMIVIVSLFLLPYSFAQSKQDVKENQARLIKEVRHELVMLPNYSLFDNLEFQIAGVDTVILSGQVTRPILKSEAENAIRRMERVGKVVNNIEVLPLSPQDDRLRTVAYKTIYSKSGLERYAQQAVPPIHIIVKNGRITLTGTVASQMDKDLAGIAAQGIPGTFGVTNNLVVKK